MKIGIIGTAGRVLDAKRLTAAHFTAMCAHTEKMLIAYTGSQPKEESGTGPRFCTVRSDEEEAQTIEEANRRGHKLFLRRYFDGERPVAPEGIEAYEAIPITVEVAATYARACARETGTIERQVTVDALVSEWLASAATPTDEAQVLQQKVKEYLGS